MFECNEKVFCNVPGGPAWSVIEHSAMFKTPEEHEEWHKEFILQNERRATRQRDEIKFIIDTIDNNTSEEAAEIIRNASPEGQWNI